METERSLSEMTGEEILEYLKELRKNRENAALDRLLEKARKISEKATGDSKKAPTMKSMQSLQSLIDSVGEDDSEC